ncbi:MAG: dUTP diphosphatase [Erysipelotrichaceae bacterium]|nr:dUTP diphosphatase [Erysipelotrichaceae bacterium]
MKIAEFEKVTRGQFEADLKALCACDEDLYDQVTIPCRATRGSAGYDFYSPLEITLNPGENVKIPTGIRCRIDEGYVLQIYPRSSFGFKYQMCLLNTTGIIDADYYHADNEGHIIVAIVNRGDRQMTIRAGERFVQGIFVKHYLADEEKNQNTRHGGFGSTG